MTMAQTAQDLSRLRVRGCDLFLLEKWDADSALSPDEQMRQIFARFLALPLPERQVYTQQVEDRRVLRSGSLSQAEQDILALARPYTERNIDGECLLLRTYYGPGSDDAFEAVVRICNESGGPYHQRFLSDAARYSYGEDWRRLFSLMPQLLEPNPRYDYEEERAAAFAEAQEAEGYDPEALGELLLSDRFNDYHLASKVGVLYVMDEETLGEDEDGSAVSHEDREILTVWYDAYGKTVRWRRDRADYVGDHMALLQTASLDDHSVWTEAEVGEDYDWDGPFGPRSTEEGGESDSDGESEHAGDP